jgi:hypothetical protein
LINRQLYPSISSSKRAIKRSASSISAWREAIDAGPSTAVVVEAFSEDAAAEEMASGSVAAGDPLAAPRSVAVAS